MNIVAWRPVLARYSRPIVSMTRAAWNASSSVTVQPPNPPPVILEPMTPFSDAARSTSRSSSGQLTSKSSRSEAWLAAVRKLPCVLCGKEGETQSAHRNEGKGLGMKTDDCLTAALCVACHHALDQGFDYTRAERRAELDKAIVLTVRELARAGVIRV